MWQLFLIFENRIGEVFSSPMNSSSSSSTSRTAIGEVTMVCVTLGPFCNVAVHILSDRCLRRQKNCSGLSVWLFYRLSGYPVKDFFSFLICYFSVFRYKIKHSFSCLICYLITWTTDATLDPSRVWYVIYLPGKLMKHFFSSRVWYVISRCLDIWRNTPSCSWYIKYRCLDTLLLVSDMLFLGA